jgi:hypothetical protein
MNELLMEVEFEIQTRKKVEMSKVNGQVGYEIRKIPKYYDNR